MTKHIYSAIVFLLWPLFISALLLRFLMGKENARSLKEKRGFATRKRPEGKLVWLHAASVGESLGLLPLIEKLENNDPELSFLITTGTLSSADILKEKIKKPTYHQFAPLDHPIWVARFLDHWRPNIAIMTESDFWPEMIFQTKKRDIPLFLMNGRMSPRSYQNWKKFERFAGKLFKSFDETLVQTKQDEIFFKTLGAHNITRTGNVKYSNPPLSADDAEKKALEKAIGKRPFWVFASTHKGEETLALKTHQTLKKSHKALLTIVILRHPKRRDEVVEELKSDFSHLTFKLRSEGGPPDTKTDIYIVDSFGELGLFYDISEIACIGGSFVKLGCHNPIEAAQLKCAILFGPHIYNFSETCDDLLKSGGALQAKEGNTLTTHIDTLLAEPKKRALLQKNAYNLCQEKSKTLDLVESRLLPYLKKL